ncbi:MAG: hypothetical protein U0168_15175 [Nannocystaceae bacterium]
MAKPFSTWQVHDNKPLETLESNLWRVEGEIPGASGTRVMTVARRKDGGLVIHNAIALVEEEMKRLEGFGEPRLLVVPNGFHRLDARIYKQRYPKLAVVCPTGARSRVAAVVPVDHGYDDAPADDDVRLAHFDGTKQREGWMQVHSPGRTTVVFNDAINNLPKLGGMFGFLLAPTGIASVPRLAKWLIIADKPAFRACLERIAAEPELGRIIVSHGAVIDREAPARLREIAAALG